MIELEAVYSSKHSNYQRTQYSGTKEELIEAGLAKPFMFEVGKSGTKCRTCRSVPLNERFKLRRLPKGLWELLCFHEEGIPPYVPEEDFFWVEQGYIETDEGLHPVRFLEHFHRTYTGGIQTDSSASERMGLVWVYYSGTKQQLCKAGLANKDMFPVSERRYQRRRSKSSPESWGDWTVEIDPSERTNPLGIWTVTYRIRLNDVSLS